MGDVGSLLEKASSASNTSRGFDARLTCERFGKGALGGCSMAMSTSMISLSVGRECACSMRWGASMLTLLDCVRPPGGVEGGRSSILRSPSTSISVSEHREGVVKSVSVLDRLG